jgi:hypothetical protein
MNKIEKLKIHIARNARFNLFQNHLFEQLKIRSFAFSY